MRLINRLKLVPWVFIFGMAWMPYAQADIDFEINGIEKELKQNVAVYLDAIPQANRKINSRLEKRISEETKKALEALGYFHSKISLSYKDRESDTDAIVVITVDKGKPIIIEDVSIKLFGDASTDPAFETILASAQKKGEVLNQGKYDQVKAAIKDLAIRRGYFKAEYIESRLEIAPSINLAFIDLVFDSGIRYKFGEVFYRGSQIEESRLDSMLDFKEGEPYLVSSLGQFNQALSNTGWFSSVLVEPKLNSLHDGEVPVVVTVDPAPRNKFETGVGYSTDTGVRFKLGWDKPWFNSRGHALNTELFVSESEQTIESNYKIPLLNAEQEYYQVQFGLENVDFDFTRSLDFTASVSRHWKFDHGWQRIAYLRWLYADFVQGDNKEVSNLILPGLNFSRIRSRGGAMPSWGDKQSFTLEMGDPFLGSEIHIVRFYGESTWIRSVNDNNRFILRGTAGSLYTDDQNRVPPTLRFYAGGDNSIRGYAYHSISPKDRTGQLLGGSYLATGSLEYNHRVTGNWWAAAFVDAGDAWSDNEPTWKSSVGIGIRWASPIGPVRFDIAHGLNNPTNPFTIHFGIGPEL